MINDAEYERLIRTVVNGEVVWVSASRIAHKPAKR